MKLSDHFKPLPWDVVAFGMPCYELADVSPEVLEYAKNTPGHYTVKINPLAAKGELHANGFYYCDSLIEPHCSRERFVSHGNPAVRLARDVPFEVVVDLCDGAFFYGRFHRDFNMARESADTRYKNWLKQFHDSGDVISVFYEQELAAFFCVSDNRLMLHAVTGKLQGKGLAKYFWSVVCNDLFQAGHKELTSSVSSTNLAVVNLYASLGFRFRNALDIYHLFVG